MPTSRGCTAFAEQMAFEGIVRCPAFRPHPLKKNMCTECFSKIEKHARTAITCDADVKHALEYGAQGEKTPSMLGPRLYLGGFRGIVNEEWMLAAGITHVVNTAKGLEMFGPKYIRAVDAAKQRGVSFLETNWVDAADFRIATDELQSAVHWIEEARQAGGAVFIYCAQGRQ